MNKPDILIIEDNKGVAETIAQALQNLYRVDIAYTGKSGIYKTDTTDYDLIILDLKLPDISSLDVCIQMRERGVSSPILVLSGQDSVMTKIKLLDAGANDYLTKPFSLGELKARMRAQIRAARSERPKTRQITIGDLCLDRQSRVVCRGTSTIALRKKEFAILECLMENAGLVVTRDMLAAKGWEDTDGLWTNTVDVHIKYLRDKIDRPFTTKFIRTVHGLGYKLEVPAIKHAPANTSGM